MEIPYITLESPQQIVHTSNLSSVQAEITTHLHPSFGTFYACSRLQRNNNPIPHSSELTLENLAELSESPLDEVHVLAGPGTIWLLSPQYLVPSDTREFEQLQQQVVSDHAKVVPDYREVIVGTSRVPLTEASNWSLSERTDEHATNRTLATYQSLMNQIKIMDSGQRNLSLNGLQYNG